MRSSDQSTKRGAINYVSEVKALKTFDEDVRLEAWRKAGKPKPGGPRFQACGWASLQMFYLPSVPARFPTCGSPSLGLEHWAHKLAACAKWVALVVAQDSRTSPMTASTSYEARSTAMLHVMACAARAQPSGPFSAINIYKGFTSDAENEDWHFSWFVRDILTTSSSSTSG